jgi:hypothetical protein
MVGGTELAKRRQDYDIIGWSVVRAGACFEDRGRIGHRLNQSVRFLDSTKWR